MQLKKIEIQGFKSFADKTEIVFLDGVTTIVGPNGSGKSNISDALKWVLGEQSAKSLRGAKMEDVIFAGTEARKKVGFAEVSMYLDNSDNTLPVEFNEVVVTRRVYRNGESNFLINGSECRLKDVQELFMDTGVGKDGYSIISQGKIDEILSTKSEERRHIFEEASGIVKYRVRKEEAVKKLTNTETTLTRVSDIINEIEQNIEPLQKKSEVAKKYLALREKLKTLDVQIFVSNINSTKNEIDKLDEIINTLTSDIEKEEEKALEYEKEKLALKERINEITLKLEEASKRYYEFENESQKLVSQIEIKETKNETLIQNIERFKEEIVEDSNKIKLLEEELENRTKKRQAMSENKKKFEDELNEKETKLKELTSKLDEKATEIETIKQNLDLKQEEKYELKANISSLETTISLNKKQIEEKQKLLDRNISQKDVLGIKKDEIFSSLNKKSNELKSVTQNLLNSENALNSKNNEKAQIEEKKSSLNQDIMTLKSKYNYLQNLENESEGYIKSVKSALDFAKSQNMNSVYGTIASVISTEEKYEYAIEIALGGYMQNIIVESEKDAKKLVEYLKENLLGRATFLPLDTIKSYNLENANKFSKYPGVIDMAINLVKFDSKYLKAMNLALGNTLIVDNVSNAIEISKKYKNSVKIVTLDGELIATTGSITGGKTKTKSAGLIGRHEKIEKLKLEIETKDKEYNNILNDLSKLNKEIDVLKEEMNSKKELKDTISLDVATYTEKYENAKAEFDKIDNLKLTTKTEIETLTKECDNAQDEILKAQNQILDIDKFIEENQGKIDEFVLENKEQGQELEYLNDDILNLKVSLSSFDESVASIDEMRDKINTDIVNFKEAISKKETNIAQFETEITSAKEEIEKFKTEIEAKHSYKDEYTKLAETLKQDKEEIVVKQDELEVKVLENVRKVEKIKEEKSKTENKKIKFDIETENLKNKMWDEYELTIASAKNLLESLPLPECNEKDIPKAAQKLRNEIKDLGEVNVGSIDEYNALKARYDFISSQKLDLEQTKDKLQNLINNVTSIMRGQFAKQFAIISENFNETFKELFGGGKAELKLSDENNILESGIEIEVQPPGKKLQNMMLLSGGERALTAIALLFAILKIKSPPFCILDEIEAALDDVNVSRFADYINKYSKSSQFIVITHRKGTMEVASSVYGVTMQEYGISKVFSMKLKK